MARTITLTVPEARKLAKHTISPDTGKMIRALCNQVGNDGELTFHNLSGLALLHIVKAADRAGIDLMNR